jgi:hypothetical protein
MLIIISVYQTVFINGIENGIEIIKAGEGKI